MTTTVINIKDAPKKFDPNGPRYVYIGRPSRFGNPFRIGKDGNRAQVIQSFRDYLAVNPVLIEQVKGELKDAILVCYCAPAACHGDVLAEVADAV